MQVLMVMVIEVIIALVFAGLVVSVVAPVVWAKQVGGSPRDRVQQARTDAQVASFRRKAAEDRLAADQAEAQRTLMNMKTTQELEKLQDAAHQRELEKPKKVKGDIVT